jgi:hypothetical protein
MSSDNTPIPNKALRRFERVEGIPLPVINELFFRMQMPENLQQAFWEQVAAKEWKEFTGRAQAITIFKDGMTMVTVEDRHGNTTLFYHPRDMIDQQLDEFQRAQNHGLKVRVMYQEEADRRPVNAIEAFVAGQE